LEVPSKGSVVLIRFPFSDLSKSKLRPAVVLASSGKKDWILCQVTSQRYTDPKAIELSKQDFQSGSLRKISFVRAGKLFTTNESLIVAEVGQLNPKALNLIIDSVISLLKKA
jgi:mRNA interferase MazF